VRYQRISEVPAAADDWNLAHNGVAGIVLLCLLLVRFAIFVCSYFFIVVIAIGEPVMGFGTTRHRLKGVVSLLAL
jgi:hypothetical protein